MTVILSYCGNTDEPSFYLGTATHPPREYRDGMSCEPCKELAEIEAQIEDLHSRLMNLHERHRRARKTRNHVHSPLIHRVPSEIGAYIFTLAFPRNTTPCCIGVEGRAIPMAITQVCHAWRVLALSTPRLWCDISVNADSQPNYPLLNHQVTHSGTMPLSIYLSARRPSSMTNDRAHQAIRWAISQLHRAASFYINVYDVEIFDRINDLGIPKAAPFLQDLHIHCMARGMRDSSRLQLAIEPPRPQSVLLSGIALNRTCLDWTNLSSLKLISHSTVFLPELLASYHLKTLVLNLDDSDQLPREQEVVVNQSIQDLTLDTFGSAYFILTTTTLPFLQNLYIDDDDLVSICPTLCKFLQRSMCQLQVLDIGLGCNASNEADIQGILENMNMLHQLTLRSTIPVLELLIRRLASQDKSFLPRLQTLFLKTTLPLPFNLLLDAMEADGPSPEVTNGPDTVRPLRSLDLDLVMRFDKGDPISRDDLLRILRLQAGKTVSISAKETDVVEYWKGKHGL